MKASELRIGNYVHMDMSIDDIEVVRLKIGDLASFAIEARELYPIPLTEEWLFLFGFENTRYGFVIMLNDGYLRIWDNEITWCGNRMKEIKYIHQLQNLYFALTGEELKLKEDEST